MIEAHENFAVPDIQALSKTILSQLKSGVERIVSFGGLSLQRRFPVGRSKVFLDREKSPLVVQRESHGSFHY